MPDYLCLSATFLARRYHGGDWPPSPARLLAALLAGRMTGAYRGEWAELRPAFTWLERQAPPNLIAPSFTGDIKYRIAVPNNDLDVAARSWVRGEAYEAAKLKTMKTISPKSLIGSPQVHYLWPLQEPAPIDELRRLAHSLHTLGWGVDMAFADAAILTEADAARLPGVRYIPGDTGTPLKVPVPGFLEDLEQTYQTFTRRVTPSGVNPSVRPTVYALQPYRIENETARPWAAFSLEPEDGSGFFSVSWRHAMRIAARLRHAAAEALRGEEDWSEDRINACALGHAENCADPSGRLSYLPLATIGHPHADGRIRRVAIVEPLGRESGALPLLRLKLNSELLQPDDGSAPCRLRAMDKDTVTEGYRRPAARWRTVTPVILHGHNARGRSVSTAKTEKLLLQAFEKAGYPPRLLASLSFQAAPYWPGTESVFAIEVPRHLNHYPRYHVEVLFRDPAHGPLAVGIGRHYGLGLFAAAGD